jgi:hypothetical protein
MVWPSRVVASGLYSSFQDWTAYPPSVSNTNPCPTEKRDSFWVPKAKEEPLHGPSFTEPGGSSNSSSGLLTWFDKASRLEIHPTSIPASA